MKRFYNLFIISAVCCIYLLYACGSNTSAKEPEKEGVILNKNEDHDHNHDHEGHNHDHENENDHNHDHEYDQTSSTTENEGDEIVLPKTAAEAAGITVNTVMPEAFQHVIKTSGTILAAQGNEATVVATVSGVISLKNNLLEGKEVSRGTSLLSVSSRNLADGDPMLKARITYETAKKEYERMKSLVESKIVSEKEFNRAIESYENARASYEALAQHHSQGGRQIVAPIAGFVKSVLVNEGDYVELGQPLVQITQNKRLYLRAEVSEKYYPVLRSVHTANFITPYDNQSYALSELNGRLVSVGKTQGSNSYYIPVTFEFDNKGDILPGAYVEIYLLSSPSKDVIALPHAALTEEQGLYFVYLQVDEEGYTKRQVFTGTDNGQMVEITNGLKPGDRVVVSGAQRVKLASASNAIPSHSHEH